MRSKMMASRQYAANQFGMSNGDPKKKKKDQEVSMSCSDKGCSAYDSGGGGSNAGTASYKGGSSNPRSGSKGEANKVLSKKQADKRADQFAKNRAKAAAANKPKSKF
jgi:hypothetical protein